MSQVLEKGRDLMDNVSVKENGFSQVNFMNLLCCKKLIEKESQFLKIFEKDFDIPLKNANCIPTMVCIAAVKDSKERDEESFGEIKSIGKLNHWWQGPMSTKKKKLCQRRNLSLLVARVCNYTRQWLCSGKSRWEMRIMADGGLFQNSPLALAIDEASRLYPGRPIGTILNLGYLDRKEPFIHRTLETARLKHPNMHFQRIAANDI